MAVEFLPGRRLAFDVGAVRVGVAGCDPEGILAHPLLTLNRKDTEQLSEAIATLLNEYEPVKIYVGLPKNLRNLETASTTDAVFFARWLAEFTSVPIWLVDERLTTATAAASLRAAGRNAKTSKDAIDQQAAVEILESALSLEKQSRPSGVQLERYEN